MTAGKYDFIMEQGSVYDQVFLYTDDSDNPIDLTGYTAKMMLREDFDSTSSYLTLDTDDGSLVLGGVNGTITCDVDATVTGALDFETAVYDLELYPAGVEANAFKVVYGTVTLRLEVTKDD